MQFNPENEEAYANCAQAYLMIDNMEKAKQHIEKTKSLNPLNQIAHIIEMQIKDRENQPIDKIISDLPEVLKDDYQMVRILSHLMIKRNHKEAEKQVNIFYKKIKEQTPENIQYQMEWVDMSLRLIVKSQDLFSPASDHLKAKLKKIINIYSSFLNKPEYNELRASNPDPYLNYALALAWNGDLVKAIHAFKNGIELFPNDSLFKIKLAQFYVAQGKWDDTIGWLENLPELKGFVESDSMNKTQQEVRVINQSQHYFQSVLMLADAYFQTKQTKKAFQFLDRVIKASFLTEDEKLAIQQFRIFRRLSLKETDKAEKELAPLFNKNQDNIFHLILKSKIEDAKVNSSITEGNIQSSENHKKQKILYLKKAWSIFKDRKQAENLNHTELQLHEHERDMEHLCRELLISQMYPEVELLLEWHTRKNLNHPRIFDLLNVYFENGKNQQAIELAKALIKKFPKDERFVNILFLVYESLGSVKTAIQVYENFISLNPDNTFIKIELACAYIQCDNLKKAKELLQKPIDINHLNAEQTRRLSYVYMRIGDIKQALKIQYHRIVNHPTELESEMVYCHLIMSLNQPKSFDFEKGFSPADFKKFESDKKLFLEPKVVKEDVWVCIQEIKILDEQEIAFPKQDITIEKTAPIYTPEHELSKALKGKKVGDFIQLKDRRYKIIEIKSKYIHKYHKILKDMDIKFPSQTFIKKVRILERIKTSEESLKETFANRQKPQDHNEQGIPSYKKGETIIRSIAKILGKQGEGWRGLEKDFETIGSIAKALRKHPIDIMGYLFSSKEDKLISSIPLLEKHQEKPLDEKSNILIDLLSLIMIHQIKIEEHVEKSHFKLYISPSSINSLKEYIEEIAIHSRDGLLTIGLDNSGKLRKNFAPAKAIKKDLNFWNKVKAWAEKHCQIKNISPDIVLSRKDRKYFEQCIGGKEFFDPILALYKDTENTVFLSEDAVLRAFIPSIYKELEAFQPLPLKSPPTSARLFDLIDGLQQEAIIDKNQVVQFKARLVKLNHTYIPMDHHILFTLLKEAEYVVSDWRFQRGLFFLSPVSDWAGVVSVTADFLLELAKEASLLPYRKQLITNAVLDQVSYGRDRSSKATAQQIIHLIRLKTQILPILQNEVRKSVIEWQRHKVY